jgi:hypothetical protein
MTPLHGLRRVGPIDGRALPAADAATISSVVAVMLGVAAERGITLITIETLYDAKAHYSR